MPTPGGGTPGNKAVAAVLKQFVSTQTGLRATGTTLIPGDDSIPQNDEGDEYMTLAITPKAANHRLIIEVTVLITCTATSRIAVALFQDDTVGALAAISQYQQTGGGGRINSFTHIMEAGTVSETTFKIRAGGHAVGTYGFNAVDATRMLGGVAASSIRIWEVEP